MAICHVRLRTHNTGVGIGSWRQSNMRITSTLYIAAVLLIGLEAHLTASSIKWIFVMKCHAA
jgi:hypothetical protein